MRNAIVCAVLVALVACASPVGAADAAAAKAQAGARAWLAVVDAGKYGESWDAAAAMFRTSIGREEWAKALGGVRAQLGGVKTRALATAKSATSLPGAPDGEYVVIQFDAAFEHKASAIETVTVVREGDGAWRVAGYFIR